MKAKAFLLPAAFVDINIDKSWSVYITGWARPVILA